MAIKAQAGSAPCLRYFRVRGVKSDPKHGLALREAAKYGGPRAIALVPEPTNKYDPNAIKVVLFRHERRFHVGYVPRDIAAQVQGRATRIRVRRWQLLFYSGKPAGLEVQYELV